MGTPIKLKYMFRFLGGIAFLCFVGWLVYWLLAEVKVTNWLGLAAIGLFLIIPGIAAAINLPAEIASLLLVLRGSNPQVLEATVEAIGHARAGEGDPVPSAFDDVEYQRGRLAFQAQQAENLRGGGHFEAAIELQQETLTELESTFGHRDEGTRFAAVSLGNAFLDHGAYAEAEQVYGRYLALAPLEITYNLACCKCMLGNLDNARALLRMHFSWKTALGLKEDAPPSLDHALRDAHLVALRRELPDLKREGMAVTSLQGV